MQTLRKRRFRLHTRSTLTPFRTTYNGTTNGKNSSVPKTFVYRCLKMRVAYPMLVKSLEAGVKSQTGVPNKKEAD
jgi:hypothetical protein